MSRYVQRCQRCRQVRGITSFRVLKGGGRTPVCRWCLDDRTTRLKLETIERRLRVLAYELASEAA